MIETENLNFRKLNVIANGATEKSIIQKLNGSKLDRHGKIEYQKFKNNTRKLLTLSHR